MLIYGDACGDGHRDDTVVEILIELDLPCPVETARDDLVEPRHHTLLKALGPWEVALETAQLDNRRRCEVPTVDDQGREAVLALVVAEPSAGLLGHPKDWVLNEEQVGPRGSLDEGVRLGVPALPIDHVDVVVVLAGGIQEVLVAATPDVERPEGLLNEEIVELAELRGAHAKRRRAIGPCPATPASCLGFRPTIL